MPIENIFNFLEGYGGRLLIERLRPPLILNRLRQNLVKIAFSPAIHLPSGTNVQPHPIDKETFGRCGFYSL